MDKKDKEKAICYTCGCVGTVLEIKNGYRKLTPCPDCFAPEKGLESQGQTDRLDVRSDADQNVCSPSHTRSDCNKQNQPCRCSTQDNSQ